MIRSMHTVGLSLRTVELLVRELLQCMGCGHGIFR